MKSVIVAAVVAVAKATICEETGEPYFRLTAQACPCCLSIEAFVQQNDYVHTLFYSRTGRLNQKIKADFEALADDWKHSKVAFGMIDVDTDRKMSEKWNDPTMIPTNILFKNHQPVEVSQEDFLHIRDKYNGSPEGQKWLLNKYLAGKNEALHHAAPLANAKRLKKFVKKNDVAIVGFFTGERGIEYKAYQKALYNLHTGVEEVHSIESKIEIRFAFVFSNFYFQTPTPSIFAHIFKFCQSI